MAILDTIKEAFAKKNNRATTLSDEDLRDMIASQEDKKKKNSVWVALMTEHEALKAIEDETPEDDEDEKTEEEEEGDTGEDDTPSDDNGDEDEAPAPKVVDTKGKGTKPVTAIVRKDAVDAAEKLAKDEAFKTDMMNGVAAGKIKRRVSALVALHIRRIFGTDLLGTLPRPGSSAEDVKGTNHPHLYDKGEKVGEAGWYRTASEHLPWVAEANKRLAFIAPMVSSKTGGTAIEGTPEDLLKMSNAALLDEQKDLTDTVNGHIAQFRTAARVLWRIEDCKELGLKASVRLVKRDGKLIIPKGISPIRVAITEPDEDGEPQTRERFFTVGAFLQVKLANVAKAEDKFAAFVVERKPKKKKGQAEDTTRDLSIHDVTDADMSVAELAHFLTSVTGKSEYLSLLLKDDSEDLLLSTEIVGRQFARYLSNPKVQAKLKVAHDNKNARDKADEKVA